MTQNENETVFFELETQKQVDKFLQFLIEEFPSRYTRPACEKDEIWLDEITRYAKSGAFWRVTVLPDGEMVWTKKM